MLLFVASGPLGFTRIILVLAFKFLREAFLLSSRWFGLAYGVRPSGLV